MCTCLNLLRTPSQFSLRPSLSGTSTRTSESPLAPNLLRWEAQKGGLSFHHPNGNPFRAMFTMSWALDIQAVNRPSRSSKLGTGDSVCPVTSSGTSEVAQSVPCLRLLVICWWASSYLSPFLVNPGHMGIDFVTDLPDSEGNTCILVAVDHFSKPAN